jgi:gamma-glutamyltranspeptidase/glutathione hydrolase
MPPSQGAIVLMELNLLCGFDMTALGFGTANSIHVMVEAKKLAFADRLKYLGDPAFIDNPLDALLSSEYADERRKALDLEKATETVPAGALPERDGDTTSLVVVDGEGNACSFIHSLSAGFGCGVVMGETGILLNNRAGRGFTLEEGHPNQLAPGKKTMHTLNTYMLFRDGLPWMVGNTPGGDNQPQWNMQVIVNLLDYGMNIQQAIEAPRWSSFPGTDPAAIEAPFELRVEERVPENVRKALAAMGHRIVVMPPWGGGGAAQGIVIDRERGILIGGSDPRAEGIALGY